MKPSYIISEAKPFFKWVGGKRQLASQILPLFPEQINSYYEPFIGGGALMWRVNAPQTIVINDLNSEITNAYEVMRGCVTYSALKPTLEHIQNVYNHLENEEEKREMFMAYRSLDRQPQTFLNANPVARASRFLFLNKTGFNGLYRQNKKGQLNTPFGKHPHVNFDFPNFEECHQHLRNVTIRNTDFALACADATKGDFVYLDPPYDPISKTASFTAYTASGFDTEMQTKVLELCLDLDKRGVKFMVSNNPTPFILSLFSQFNIQFVSARRNINSNGNGRGAVQEALITNY